MQQVEPSDRKREGLLVLFTECSGLMAFPVLSV